MRFLFICSVMVNGYFVPSTQMYILRKLSMVAITSALNLDNDGITDFYICSLSSRYFVKRWRFLFLRKLLLTSNHFATSYHYLQDCCLQRSVNTSSVEGLLFCRPWQ